VNGRPVHAVVVAYGQSEQLNRCLAALEQKVATTVVDNSSSADVAVVVARHGADYCDLGVNLGFAAGVNVALRTLLTGSPQDVLLLNPDAVFPWSDLETTVAQLHRSGNERVAAVSPRLIGTDGLPQRVVWPFPSPARALAEAFGLGRLPTRDTFVIGAALVLRWEALREVGLFDERFFLYAEEADWQRRARSLGWESALCGAAVASHVGAGTSGDSRRRESLFHAAQETYIRKWYGRAGWWLYRAAAFVGAAMRSVILVGERRRSAARRALLYLRGPRRCAALAGE
jgi:GT2 family glycosyltransferase